MIFHLPCWSHAEQTKHNQGLEFNKKIYWHSARSTDSAFCRYDLWKVNARLLYIGRSAWRLNKNNLCMKDLAMWKDTLPIKTQLQIFKLDTYTNAVDNVTEKSEKHGFASVILKDTELKMLQSWCLCHHLPSVVKHPQFWNFNNWMFTCLRYKNWNYA